MNYDHNDISGAWLSAREKLNELGDLMTTPGHNTFDIMQACYAMHALSMQMVVLAARDHEKSKAQRRNVS